MTYDTVLKTKMVELMRRDYEAKAALHEPSGKLSASQLGKPLLEQCLKIIGVPGKPVDDYALGLFERGNQAEKWFIDLFKPDEAQKAAEYRGVIGFIDAVKDKMIYEVKSIKNSQVQYIDPENTATRFFGLPDGSKVKRRVYSGAKYQNVLQGALYALSEGSDTFTIVYVSADDLRCYPHVIPTAEIKPTVDRIIDEVANQLKSHTLPVFQPRADFNGEVQNWQTDPKYSNYPEWCTLPPELMLEKLQRQYPDSYKKLKEIK